MHKSYLFLETIIISTLIYLISLFLILRFLENNSLLSLYLFIIADIASRFGYIPNLKRVFSIQVSIISFPINISFIVSTNSIKYKLAEANLSGLLLFFISSSLLS